MGGGGRLESVIPKHILQLTNQNETSYRKQVAWWDKSLVITFSSPKDMGWNSIFLYKGTIDYDPIFTP